MSSAERRVTRFDAITQTRNGRTMPLASIIDEIRSTRRQKHVELARAAFQHHGKHSDDYRRVKNALPYFTPAGIFGRRSSDGLITSSGIVQGDIDELTGQRDRLRA